MKRTFTAALTLSIALIVAVPTAIPANAVSPASSSVVSVRKVGKVTGVTLKSRTSKTVVVQWKKVSGAKSYRVKVGSKTITTKKRSLKVKASTNQTVRVRAVGAKSKNVGPWSSTQRVQPVQPETVSILADSNYNPRVEWSRVAGAVSYEVKQGNRIYPATSSLINVYLASDTPISVRAVSKYGVKSAWSAGVYRTPPKLRNVKISATTQSFAHVTWDPAPGIPIIEVREKDLTYRRYDKTSFDVVLRAGQTIQVRAIGATGKAGPWSDVLIKPYSWYDVLDLELERSSIERSIALKLELIAQYNAGINDDSIRLGYPYISAEERASLQANIERKKALKAAAHAGYLKLLERRNEIDAILAIIQS